MYNCVIDMQEGAQLPFGPIYNLLQNKFVVWKDYIEDNLAKKLHLAFKVSCRDAYLVHIGEK